MTHTVVFFLRLIEDFLSHCSSRSQLRAAVSNTTKSPLQLCSGHSLAMCWAVWFAAPHSHDADGDSPTRFMWSGLQRHTHTMLMATVPSGSCGLACSAALTRCWWRQSHQVHVVWLAAPHSHDADGDSPIRFMWSGLQRRTHMMLMATVPSGSCGLACSAALTWCWWRQSHQVHVVWLTGLQRRTHTMLMATVPSGSCGLACSAALTRCWWWQSHQVHVVWLAAPHSHDADGDSPIRFMWSGLQRRTHTMLMATVPSGSCGLACSTALTRCRWWQSHQVHVVWLAAPHSHDADGDSPIRFMWSGLQRRTHTMLMATVPSGSCGLACSAALTRCWWWQSHQVHVVWLAAPHSHDADGDSPIRFMWSGLQRRTHTMLMVTVPPGSCGLACSAALTRCWWRQSHQVHVVWLAAPHSHDADGDSPTRFMWSGLQRRTHTMLMVTVPSGSCGLACSAALTRCWWWQSHQVHVVWLAAPHSHDADGDSPIRFMWSGLQRRTHTMLMVTVPSGSCGLACSAALTRCWWRQSHQVHVVWLAAPHSHDADGDSPIRFMWSGLQRRTHTMLMATVPPGSCGLACSAALTRCWWRQSHQVHVVWLAAPHSHDADGDSPLVHVGVKPAITSSYTVQVP